MKRKLVSTGLIAGLVAGTGAGLILQQTGPAGASSAVSVMAVDGSTDTTDTTGTTDPAPTVADGFDRTERLTERLTEVLQPLVDDGTLTADQLAAVIAALDEAGPLAGGPGGFGDHRGPGHGGPGHGGRGGRGFGLEAAATALGLTVEELRIELEGGSTIAAVATEQGVDVPTVIDALVAEATTRLNERVTAGDLTQDEADAKVAELTTRITEMVNNVRPARPGHGHDADDESVDAPVDTAAAAG